MTKHKHLELLEKFIANGGNPAFAERIKGFSLSNFAKLKYEFSKLKPAIVRSEETPQSPPPSPKKRVFNDFIADYPTELHIVYKRRWELWLEACSLKIKLSQIKPNEEDKAMDLQLKIYYLFQEFDQCQKILKHYQEHKRIMPTVVQTDFSKMSELEIYKYRDNLRALITRRKQTIEKMERELDQVEEITPKALHTLNLKKEQLQEKINELLECEKHLKNE